MMEIKEAVEKLNTELTKLAVAMEYPSPVVRGNVIEWEGPFEWAIVLLGGSSMIAWELGEGHRAPGKIEVSLQATIKAIEKAGFCIEATSPHSIGVFS